MIIVPNPFMLWKNIWIIFLRRGTCVSGSVTPNFVAFASIWRRSCRHFTLKNIQFLSDRLKDDGPYVFVLGGLLERRVIQIVF